MTNLAEKVIEKNKDSDKIAYVLADRNVTYKKLCSNAASVYNSLIDFQCKSNERILIYLYDSPAISEIFLASLALGVIPIIINPRLSKESLTYIIQDSECSLIFCEKDNENTVHHVLSELDKIESCRSILQDHYNTCTTSAHTESIDHFNFYSEALNKSGNIEYYKGNLDVGAFWQYTSGTTGNPKAVMHSHDTMIGNTLSYAVKTMHLSGNDIFYSAAKMFFGYGAGGSLFFPLLLGATAVLDHRMPSTDIAIIQNIIKHRPTVFFGAPHIYASLIPHSNRLREIFNDGLTCISAGAPLPASILEEWIAAFEFNIYDGIGATEMGHIFLSNSKENMKSGTTGKPVENYEVKLINPINGELVEAHINQGVLCVKGPYKNIGYWNHEEKTKEKFIDDWYVTGDAFSVDSEGYYTYLGRQDDLFKVDGIWVEPLAIESKFAKNAEFIHECALVPHINENGLIEPVLYFSINITDKTEKEILTDIKKIALSICERHCIPKQYFIIDLLPRNDNGKVVRHKLHKNLQTLIPSGS